MIIYVFIWCYFPLARRAFFNISCSVDQLATKFSTFHLFENVLNSFSYLMDNFAGYRNLD